MPARYSSDGRQSERPWQLSLSWRVQQRRLELQSLPRVGEASLQSHPWMFAPASAALLKPSKLHRARRLPTASVYADRSSPSQFSVSVGFDALPSFLSNDLYERGAAAASS